MPTPTTHTTSALRQRPPPGSNSGHRKTGSLGSVGDTSNASSSSRLCDADRAAAPADAAADIADDDTTTCSSSSRGSCSCSSGVNVAGGQAAADAAHTTGVRSTRSRDPWLMARRVAGLHATFVFSGLWHMLIFYFATGLVTPHWLAFFSLQGPIMAAEAVLKHVCVGRWGVALPPLVSVPLTNLLLIVVARPLFFGPCDWSGLCTAMMANVRGGAGGAAHAR